MNKLVYTLLVSKESCEIVESLLGKFRVGINDWDRTRVMYLYDRAMVNYTIICEPSKYEDILSAYYRTL